MLQWWDSVAETTGSGAIGRALEDVRESVCRGESVAGPLAGHDVFPPMVVQMVASGEETGAIDQQLQKISVISADEVEAYTDELTALIEPSLNDFLGARAGEMIIALSMPRF